MKGKRSSSRCIARSQEAEIPPFPEVARSGLLHSESDRKVFVVNCAAASSGKVGIVDIGRNSLGGPFWIDEHSSSQICIPAERERVVGESF